MSAPIFGSLEDYEQNGGLEHCAKWETALQIIKHDCLHDDIPPCTVNEAGEIQIPALSPGATVKPTQNQKIAVFMEFKSNAPAFASAIHVKLNIGALVLDGDKDASVRLPIIDKWKCGKVVNGLRIRVLIFTNVLKAGVNLSAADRLILMVSPLLGSSEQHQHVVLLLDIHIPLEFPMEPARYQSDHCSSSQATPEVTGLLLPYVHGEFC
jgi:hypothetical protein